MKETEISNINDIELFKQKIKFLEENNASLEKELQENKMKYRKIANEIIEIKEEVNMHSYWQLLVKTTENATQLDTINELTSKINNYIKKDEKQQQDINLYTSQLEVLKVVSLNKSSQ